MNRSNYIMVVQATVVLMASTKAFQAFGTSSNLVSRSTYSTSLKYSRLLLSGLFIDLEILWYLMSSLVLAIS